MLKLALPLSVVLATALLAPRTAAQCTPFGTPCTGGATLLCLNNAPPRIGSSWQVCDRTACGGSSATPMVTLFGGCQSPGVPITPPIACATCPACEWQTLPPIAELNWTWPPRCTTVPIPNDMNLVGVSFCIQNACVNRSGTSPCACLSNVLRVTIMP